MNTALIRWVSRVLIVCMSALPVQLGAGPMSTDAVVPAAQAQAARVTVKQFLYREEVASKFEMLGIAPQIAKLRVDVLTDAEVVKIAGQIDSLPAAGTGVGMGMVIVIIFLLYRFFGESAAAEKDKRGTPAPKKEAPKK